MRRQTRNILIGGSITILVLFLLYTLNRSKKRVARINSQSRTIFTCTTFFDFKTGDRWDRFCKAIDSLQRFHNEETLSRINKWVVVNEYSDSPREDWGAKISERYPFITFIQKGSSQKGQAASMNIILQEIRSYTFWIHWEETWEVRAAFLEDAFNVMETTDITQLQFTFHNGEVNWMNMPNDKISCEGRVCRIRAMDGINEMIKKNPYTDWSNAMFPNWPLYSLLPSINRVGPYLSLGEFSEDPALWPIKFEWDYGRRWYRAGCTKAVLKDGPVWRPGSHTSTYEKS